MSEAAAAPGEGRPSAGKGAIWALVLLGLVNLLNYYDRLLIVVLAQPIRLEFELTDTQYGLLTGPAFVVIYSVSSVLLGFLADRHDRRLIIGSALTVWSGMTALFGLAGNFTTLLLARAGVGVGEGGSSPCGFSYISERFDPQRRAMALGLFTSGGMIGVLLSFLIGSWIAIEYGWRWAFISAGVVGILLAGLVVLTLPEKRRKQQADGARRDSLSRELRSLLAHRAYVRLCIGAGICGFGSAGILAWLPLFFIRSHGLEQREIGLYFGPAAAAGLCLGLWIGAWLATRAARISLSRPVVLCITCNFALVPLYLIVLWAPRMEVALIFMFVSMTVSLIYAPAFQGTMQTVVRPDQRALAAGASNVLITCLGQGVLPLAVGIMSDAFMPAFDTEALRLALTISLVFLAIGALVFWRALGDTERHFAINEGDQPLQEPGP